MLDELIVDNLGIIRSAHIEPGPGLVVVTGETGAGKTMLLGALRLLLGAASRRDSVGPAGNEAFVDGRFLFGDEVTLRRRVTGTGRSKAYIDGSMVPAKALQERTRADVEIVGQHDHMLLMQPSGVLRLVDEALGTAGKKAAAAYVDAWQQLVEVRQQLELLGRGRRELERELEVLRFQVDEIDSAGFVAGDDLEMRTKATRLRNSEDLVAGFAAVLESLGDEGGSAYLEAAAREMRRLSGIDPSLAGSEARLAEIVAAVADLQIELASMAAALEHDPGELEEVEARIQLLGELRRKYGESLDEVLAFGSDARARTAELSELLTRADDLAGDLGVKQDAAAAAAVILRRERLKTARALEKAAVSHLRDLGMSDPIVRLEFTETDLGPTGSDRVELSFASEQGLPTGPANRVASGGELSRLTLALRLAGGIADAELIAFDEVDAGIGGATARAMGEKLAALSRGRQVLCVTHLPQVAAHADTHFVITRVDGTAVVKRVAGEERLAELSRMLGGLPDSERGQLHAAELLAAVEANL
ncbi:MAG: AAA family ATPase [Acidimicrobiia bacterium]|nr:AAA family ATPase [Acidimicrobiia bacterium]